MRPPVPRLIPILPGHDPEAHQKAEAALAGGAPALLLRAPGMPGGPLLALAWALRGPTRERGALLLISDRVDVAAIVEADGVHLPSRGLGVAEAREMLGPDALVGRSCHDREALKSAADEGADYALLSPLFPTTSHAERSALGAAAFAAAQQGIEVPVLALGGITAERISEALAAGAHGVAAISAVFGAGDPAAAVRAISELLPRSR